MNKCERIWEVEAARDGRISGEDRARVERHIVSCADCEREQQALSALNARLRSLAAPGADELRVRRRRHELLRKANGEGLALGRPRVVRRSLVGAGLLLAIAAGCWVWYSGARAPATEQAARPQRATATLVVQADPGALFRRGNEGGLEIIDLRAGRVTLIVKRAGAEGGIRVRTPDGEIEDVGTTFAVTVTNGRTEAIEVFEGRVLARIADHEPRILGPGDRYQPYPNASSDLVSSPNRARPKRHHAPAASAAKSEEPLAELPTAPARDEFVDAFDAFEAGEMSHAATLFFRFEARHRDDVRAEDAAFLRLVALIRAGRAEEANFAARMYLERYPHGLRAQDVQRLLTP